VVDRPVGTVYLLKRAELAVRGCAELALAEVALTPSQYFIPVSRQTGEASSSAELARAMGVLPQSMTELIGLLEQRGSIVRRPDAANARILRIELTAEGERLFARATEIAIRLERELLEDFDERELARLNRAFTKLTERAEAHPITRSCGA
jgi:DNA-binding MarR family transcriptional regulator